MLWSFDQEALTLHQVKAHNVRAFAASKAFQLGISLEQILSACYWKSHNTFTQFYLKDVAWADSELFHLGPQVAAQQRLQEWELCVCKYCIYSFSCIHTKKILKKTKTKKLGYASFGRFIFWDWTEPSLPYLREGLQKRRGGNIGISPVIGYHYLTIGQ